MPTPPLPPWIREAAVGGYLTAHTLLPGETRLYGTESLYGDWDAPVLLLAKDFAPSKVLHERLAAGETRPYRHEPERIANLGQEIARGQQRADCGCIDGCATAD